MIPQSTNRGEFWEGNDPGIRKILVPDRREKCFQRNALNPSN